MAFDHEIARVFLHNAESYSPGHQELQLTDKHFGAINGSVYRLKGPDALTGPVESLVSGPPVVAKPG